MLSSAFSYHLEATMKLLPAISVLIATTVLSCLVECRGQNSESKTRLTVEQRVPSWAKDAIFYQVFPERFRNGDPSNDPVRESLEFVDIMPKSWRITPWTAQWYKRDQWEKELGDNFYEDGVFHRRFG